LSFFNERENERGRVKEREREKEGEREREGAILRGRENGENLDHDVNAFEVLQSFPEQSVKATFEEDCYIYFRNA
jgi:hypothetical protein